MRTPTSGGSSFDSLNYPDFDLCNPTPQSRTWDVVICEQVLEHVIDPFGAAANLRALCAPGGHVIVTTPFLIKVHELPLYGMNDYWRFTPQRAARAARAGRPHGSTRSAPGATG